jgi:uncharacterized protein (TIGR02246 family)
MWKNKIAIVVLLSSVMPFSVLAQSDDEKKIRKSVDLLVSSLNSRDATAIANLYEIDADRRNGRGEWASGRAKIGKMYQQAAQAMPKELSVKFDYTVRFVVPDVALVDGTWMAGEYMKGPFTVVMVNRSGTWLIAAGRQGSAFNSANK